MNLEDAAQPVGVTGAATAIVLALWAALRGATAKREAGLEAELATERTERRRERDEYRAELAAVRAESRDALAALGAKLDAERAARQADDLRSARALWQARPGAATAEDWEESAPTGVRHMLSVASQRPVDLLLARADAQPVGLWSDSIPPRNDRTRAR
jgi:hypothetical protein